MTSIIEPIGAGIVVALINKFIINNHSLWAYCSGFRPDKKDEHEHEEDVSSTSTTTVDTLEVHAHI